MSDSVTINLNIADSFNIRLTVSRDREAQYRQARDVLNERYKKYASRYPSKPLAELWLYVALDVAVMLQSDAREKSLEPYVQVVDALNKEIENTIQ